MSPTAYDDWLGRTRGPLQSSPLRSLLRRRRSGRLTRALLVTVTMIVGAITMAGPASATWSVVATDPATGQIGAAVASCTDARDLTTTMALVPGAGGAVSVGPSADLTPVLLASALRGGSSPQQVTTAVQNAAVDGGASMRQYGVAVSGVGAHASTGADTSKTSGARVSSDGSATIQGNLLASPAVLDDVTKAFDTTTGPLATRLLAAIDAGAAAGGDRGCGAKARSASLVVVGNSSALFVPAATAAAPADAATTLLAAKDLTPAELSARLGAESVLPAPRGARAPLVYVSTIASPGDDALEVIGTRYQAQLAASARRAAPAASEEIVDPSVSSELTTVALVVFALIGLVIAALIIGGLRRSDRRAAAARAAEGESITPRRTVYRGEVTNLFDLDLTTAMRRKRETERQAQRIERTRESVWSGSSW